MLAKILYDLSIWGYWFLLKLAAPFHAKAAQMLTGRKDLFRQLESKLAGNTNPVAWFHCASLGEFEQGRPLMEAFSKAYPEYKIALTFFSSSGYDVRKNYAGAAYVFYLPSDSDKNARRFLDILQPKIAVFVKYEFWHYYLQELHARNIPVISVSAIFRENQLFFKPYGAFYRQILKNLSFIFTQNLQSENLLKNIGIENVQVAGDTRFDRVLQTAQEAKKLPVIEKFIGAEQKPVFIIGSSWPEDMSVLEPFIQKYLKQIKFIIAPHEIQETAIRNQVLKFNSQAVRFSEAANVNPSEYSVLVIDNVGMLSSIYAYGNFAYIGGAFGKGLHNTLEAAVFGLPLFFGPKFDKFQEAKDLVQLKTAFPVHTTAELEEAFSAVNSAENSSQISEKLKTYVAQNAGATQLIMNWISTTI